MEPVYECNEYYGMNLVSMSKVSVLERATLQHHA